MRPTGRRLLAAAAVICLTSACGGDDEPEAVTTEQPTEALTTEDEPTEEEPTETEPEPTETEPTEAEPEDLATTAEEPADLSTTAEEPAGGLGTTAEEPPAPAPVEPPPPAIDAVPGLLLGGEPQELEQLCRKGEVVVANYIFEASIEFTPFGTSTVGIRAFTDGSDVVTYGTQTTTDDAVVLEGSFADGAFPPIELLLDPGTPLPDCPFEYEPVPVPPQDG